MEQIVKPTLMAIPGVRRVTHRARARDGELETAPLALARTQPAMPIRIHAA